MSEVEEFERVRIGHLRDATLTGPVVIDFAPNVTGTSPLASILSNATSDRASRPTTVAAYSFRGSPIATFTSSAPSITCAFVNT